MKYPLIPGELDTIDLLKKEIYLLQKQLEETKESEFYALRAIDHYQDINSKLEKKLGIAKEALKKIAELPDIDQDYGCIIARNAFEEIGE